MAKILCGNSITGNKNAELQGDDSVCILGLNFKGELTKLKISDEILSRHIMLMGNTGTGKTNVFDFILSELRRNSSERDVFIVFDSKGDFIKKHWKENDQVLGNGKKYRKYSAIWNIFDEIQMTSGDQEDIEINSREFSKSLFSDRKNKSQPFFSNAAQDIFANMLIYTCRKFKEKPENFNYYLNNKQFIHMLKSFNSVNYQDCFNHYSDMKSLMNYLGEGGNLQGLGVLAELNSMINDYFVGIFAQEADKTFSMRKFVRNRGGNAVFIEYDIASGEVFEPIYRILFDLALKEVMSQEETSGNVYLIADEFKMIPKLQHIGNALNFGRSKGIKILAGIQSISQLEAIYGKTESEVMMAGFSSIISFKCNDPSSREYLSKRLGRNLSLIDYINQYDEIGTHVREGYVVEDWFQNNYLKTKGNAIISLIENDPFCFHFNLYKEQEV